MYSTGITSPLTVFHAMRGDFGREAHPHFHPYLVEWTIDSDKVDANGFATDISAMEEVLRELVGELGGAFLNTLPFFREEQTSLENLARFLHGELTRRLQERNVATGTAMEIRIWESENAWASYRV
ncbi:MAG: 6-carboxytetrahydropterin synthase [bacterium]